MLQSFLHCIFLLYMQDILSYFPISYNRMQGSRQDAWPGSADSEAAAILPFRSRQRSPVSTAARDGMRRWPDSGARCSAKCRYASDRHRHRRRKGSRSRPRGVSHRRTCLRRWLLPRGSRRRPGGRLFGTW